MCIAIAALGMTAMETAMAGAAVATTAASVIGQEESAKANATAIENQQAVQALQISQQAGQQESIAATQARAARASSIVNASGAGINLGSNSFLGSLQTTTMNQYDENGLILDNEKNSQAASVANEQSLLNSKASSPTFLGASLDLALSGTDAYMAGKANYNKGVASQNGGVTTTD